MGGVWMLTPEYYSSMYKINWTSFDADPMLHFFNKSKFIFRSAYGGYRGGHVINVSCLGVYGKGYVNHVVTVVMLGFTVRWS
jgi:hypothetical protein